MSLARAHVKLFRSLGPVDVAIFSLLALFTYALVRVAAEWTGPFTSNTSIDLSYEALPWYAFLSLVRGFIAYALSLVFTIGYGYVAAHSRIAERFLVPLLDILQSIPVLGFLPGVVLALVTLFPDSNIGVELACILMIFTGQVWNMTFSFYGSVKTVPREMRELASLTHLSRWDVLRKIEIPFSMNRLLWNSMLSMAGGWFFLTVVESFSLGEQTFRLPGIGSYMAVAIETGNAGAMIAGIGAMILVIVLVDRCLWAPLVYLSSRYQSSGEATAGSTTLEPPLMLRWLQRSQILRAYYELRDWWSRRREDKPVGGGRAAKVRSERPLFPRYARVLFGCLLVALVAAGAVSLYGLLSRVSAASWWAYLRDTGLTFLRVTGAVVMGTLWTVPVGVWIGTHPRWTSRLQPVVQVIAAFPAPMIFPLVTYLFLSAGIPFTLGATLLMLIGSQFYILFNVISGATQIPASLMEVARSYGVTGISYWRVVILPAIFPSLLNGWITAAGGAWNASIVSEYVNYGGKTLVASGIGATITEAAQHGDFAGLAGGIFVMVTALILINRFFWGRLYRLAETKYKLEL